MVFWFFLYNTENNQCIDCVNSYELAKLYALNHTENTQVFLPQDLNINKMIKKTFSKYTKYIFNHKNIRYISIDNSGILVIRIDAHSNTICILPDILEEN